MCSAVALEIHWEDDVYQDIVEKPAFIQELEQRVEHVEAQLADQREIRKQKRREQEQLLTELGF